MVVAKPETTEMCEPNACQIVYANEVELYPEPPTVPEIIVEEANKADVSADVMLEIADAESDFRPKVSNPHSSATGLFQIVIGTWNYFNCEGKRTSARDNARCAMKIAKDGLHHWNASAHDWRN